MKLEMHRANSRGGANYSWLSTRHSFSFANWYEPSRMGFGALRVLNDDRVAPNNGFGAHSHADMEIITIVMSGAVTHKDSIGNEKVVAAGEIQVMSAGSGVTHSETNDSPDEQVDFFQIWIKPKELGITPHYGQRSFNSDGPGLTLLVAPQGHGEGLHICQDAYLYRGLIISEVPTHFTPMVAGHGVYLFVIDGSLKVAGQELSSRDALGISEFGNGEKITIESSGSATFLLIEVPMED